MIACIDDTDSGEDTLLLLLEMLGLILWFGRIRVLGDGIMHMDSIGWSAGSHHPSFRMPQTVCAAIYLLRAFYCQLVQHPRH